MTKENMDKIYTLKDTGLSIRNIAKTLNVPFSTVQSFLKKYPVRVGNFCKCCGKKVPYSRFKPREYCSNYFRRKWYRNHKFGETRICIGCGREFQIKNHHDNHYCSRECYLNSVKKK